MKTIYILLVSLLCSNLFAQEFTEKQIKTEVNEVTVFIEGAQVMRKKNVDLVPGKTILKFVGLSPFIDAKSLQVKAQGQLTVLSVNHQQNYLDTLDKINNTDLLISALNKLEEKSRLETTHLAILKEELAFLQENRNIGGRNDQVSVSNLQQASDFYGSKLTSLKLKEIERNKTIADLDEQMRLIRNQIKTLSDTKAFPSGEILVKVDAKKAGSFSFELSYVVSNAGWFPTYDIRAKNISEPIQLFYKANVRQDTKVDWKNVKLKFSSSNPNVSGVAPELKPYYLDYYTLPPSYQLKNNNISGNILDNKGEPLYGVTIVVEGTTIGAISDFNGHYSITIPNNANRLVFSYIGYETQTLPIRNDVMNVVMQESAMMIQEVVVAQRSVGNNKLEMLQGKIAGVSADKSRVKVRGTSSLAIPTAQVENQTTVDFEIKTPYSIKSDNKSYSVDMDFYDLPALYQYYCVPKVDKDAFLIAHIVDWEKYNLMEGEVNVFFEDTYVGKTILDVRYAADTLDISLGRDKKVSVTREKVKDFTSRQFIGNKKEETRAWKTTVKNNKNQEINMIVLDQIPVSTSEEIEVDVQNISGARQNNETGEIKWAFKLKASDKREFDLKYSVKYPKSRILVIE